jgi:hypothetical protein
MSYNWRKHIKPRGGHHGNRGGFDTSSSGHNDNVNTGGGTGFGGRGRSSSRGGPSSYSSEGSYGRRGRGGGHRLENQWTHSSTNNTTRGRGGTDDDQQSTNDIDHLHDDAEVEDHESFQRSKHARTDHSSSLSPPLSLPTSSSLTTRTLVQLQELLRSIDGGGYSCYKQLIGTSWLIGDDMTVNNLQLSASAAPSLGSSLSSYIMMS